MSTATRLAVLAGVIVVAIAGLVLARGGSDDESPPAQTTTTTQAKTKTSTTTNDAPTPANPLHRIVVKDAKPVGGVQQIKVKKGDPVRIAVASDTADEIHIHGYDLMKDVEAGGSVRFAFNATGDGNYEIELEDHKEQIAELTVEP